MMKKNVFPFLIGFLFPIFAVAQNVVSTSIMSSMPTTQNRKEVLATSSANEFIPALEGFRSDKIPQLAIHACLGIVNHPTVTAEYRLLTHKEKIQTHLYTSIGYSHLSFYRAVGNGIEWKVGGQYEFLEINAGLWLPLPYPTYSDYEEVMPAIQLGYRGRSLD
jgi:hypothetical protein